MAHNKDGCLAGDRLNLLKSSENKDRCLSETRFGLAKDIGTEDCLRNAYLLDCRVNRADVRSKCFFQVFEDVQGIATSVHLRSTTSTVEITPKEIKTSKQRCDMCL
jgi:hypothetical protein